MPTYKGNRGNLLQHWVLVEVIGAIREAIEPAQGICFIDAHAMSPYARRDPSPGRTAAEFDRVALDLPGQGSAYERAWHELRQGRCRYPSSAALVRHLWRAPLNLELCEADKATADEICEWQQTLGDDASLEIHRGDWRARFRRGFPRDFAAHLISFDPYMFDRHGPAISPKLGNMCPDDISTVGAALQALGERVVLQLSTYSANNANSQEDVIATLEPAFASAGVKLVEKVRVDGNMMSLIFARGIPQIREAKLQQRFTDWLEHASSPPKARSQL